jgi:hypothetical protein
LQLACNLGAPEARGKTLFLWNTFDDDRMKDVPFFCFSHLVMRIEVAASCTPRPGFPVSAWRELRSKPGSCLAGLPVSYAGVLSSSCLALNT